MALFDFALRGMIYLRAPIREAEKRARACQSPDAAQDFPRTTDRGVTAVQWWSCEAPVTLKCNTVV